MWMAAILFFIIGIIMLMGKGSYLVAGYNTMDDETKKKYNQKRITQATGGVALFTSLYFVMLSYVPSASVILTSLLVIVCLGVVVLINSHPYFKNDEYDS